MILALLESEGSGLLPKATTGLSLLFSSHTVGGAGEDLGLKASLRWDSVSLATKIGVIEVLMSENHPVGALETWGLETW